MAIVIRVVLTLLVFFFVYGAAAAFWLDPDCLSVKVVMAILEVIFWILFVFLVVVLICAIWWNPLYSCVKEVIECCLRC